MSRDPRTLLCFDYGTKRIGVAVGQAITATASPVETIHSKGEQPDWTAISRLIETWQPDTLIVGRPLNMDGSENEMTRAAEKFTNRLRGRYHLPIISIDERLSSIAAEEVLEARGVKNKAAMIDQIAAQLILETYFSEQQTGSRDNGDELLNQGNEQST